MKPRALAGSIMLVSSLFFFGFGGFVAFKSLSNSRTIEAASVQSEASCKKQLAQLGGTVRDAGTMIVVTVKDVKDTKQSMADAAAALAMCPTRSITDFCLGSVCGLSGTERPSRQVNLTFNLTGR